MMERIFLRLGSDCALGADDLQWILYRRSYRKPLSDALNGKNWRACSFVRSEKAILLRCIREKELPVSVEGERALGGLPSTFDEWKAAQSSPESLAP
jgi:hypothetical protein